MTQKTIIAAFDFDGTLTNQDSLLTFLKYACGTTKTTLAIAKSLPILLLTSVGLASRQQAKEELVTHLFKGMEKPALAKVAQAFAEGPLNDILRPEILEKYREHKKEGHCCLLVSANLNIYIEPWGVNNGFDAVLCSRLAVDPQGLITGKLEGPNCWGPEKVRRLIEYIQKPRDTYTLYAYGDSRGDSDLLAFADYPFKV